MKQTFKFFACQVLPFVICLLLILQPWVVFSNDDVEHPEHIKKIFDEIIVKLDEIDIPLETDLDRIKVIISTRLLMHGYTEENSGILIKGTKRDIFENGIFVETIKIIEEIIVQIHEDETYTLEYIVPFPLPLPPFEEGEKLNA